MIRVIAPTILLVLVISPTRADEPKPQTEQELLTALKKLAEPPTKKELLGLDVDEQREFMKERAKTALKLLGAG
jgi:hypothetical protein